MEDVPVGDGYIIGPGDSFTITLWGISEGIFKVTVKSDGTIVLPKAGVVSIAGMTFGQMREYLQDTLGRYFEGVNLAVTMDKIRTIRAYIIGEVGRPGSYSLSSLSTVYSALFSAGGPTKKGTLRDIQLIRNDKVIANIDLYDFLLKGAKDQDRRLESGDTIFVPFIGSTIGISGAVNRPAIYEVKGIPRLKDLLWLAGGFTPTSDLTRIQIERLIEHDKRIVIDKNISRYKKDAKLQSFPLKNRDYVRVFSISGGVQNIVNLAGNVARPGRYEWKEGMRLLDLFPNGYADLKPQPFEEYGYITRLVPPAMHEKNISFSLKKLLEGDASQNVLLSKMDKIKILSLKEESSGKSVSITGFVRKPGAYSYREGLTLKDLIYQAGNVVERAYAEEIEVFRTEIKGDKAEHLRFTVNLKKVFADDPKHNLDLQNLDRVNIRNIQDWYQGSVTFSGQVKFPGTYPISRGERLSSVLERAGGFADDAYLFGAVFTRKSVKSAQDENVQQLLDKIEAGMIKEAQGIQLGEVKGKTQAELERNRKLLDRISASRTKGRVILKLSGLNGFKDSQEDIELEDGDSLTVPAKTDVITVIGEVYNPAGVLYEADKNVFYYLERVGGTIAQGDSDNIYVLRADGSVLSKSGGTLNVYWDKLSPGDVVVVPPRFEKPVDYFQIVKDVTKLIFELVMTYSVIRSATQ